MANGHLKGGQHHSLLGECHIKPSSLLLKRMMEIKTPDGTKCRWRCGSVRTSNTANGNAN